MGLLKKGASAYAGKATLPIATLITKESGGTPAITQMKTKKRDIFKDKRWGLRNRLQRKMTSRIHGLTDYRVFDEYTKMQPLLFNYDALLWGEYAEWLSGKKTTQKQFVEEATGQAMVTAAAGSSPAAAAGSSPVGAAGSPAAGSPAAGRTSPAAACSGLPGDSHPAHAGAAAATWRPTARPYPPSNSSSSLRPKGGAR